MARSFTSSRERAAILFASFTLGLHLLISGCDSRQPVLREGNADSASDPRDSVAPASETAVAFSSGGCMERHFPLARMVEPPPEVRFYCAAPWNRDSFEQVRQVLDQAGVDVVGIAIRNTAPENREMMTAVAPLALDQADQGPPGMGALYRAYKVLPLLQALHRGTDEDLFAGLTPEDVEALRRAAGALDWDAPALESGSADQSAAGLAADARIADVPDLILRIAN